MNQPNHPGGFCFELTVGTWKKLIGFFSSWIFRSGLLPRAAQFILSSNSRIFPSPELKRSKQGSRIYSEQTAMSFPKAPLTRLFDKVGSDVPGPGHYDPRGKKSAVPATFGRSTRFQLAKEQNNLDESCICPHSSHKNHVAGKRHCIQHDPSARKLFASSSSISRPVVKKNQNQETTSQPLEEKDGQDAARPLHASVVDAPLNLGALLSAAFSDENIQAKPPSSSPSPMPIPSIDFQEFSSENGTAAREAEEDAIQFGAGVEEELSSGDAFGSSPMPVVNHEGFEGEDSAPEYHDGHGDHDCTSFLAKQEAETEDVGDQDEEPDTQQSVMMDEVETAKSPEDEPEPEQIIQLSEAEKEKIAVMERKIAFAQTTLHRMKEQAALVIAERDEKYARLEKMRNDNQSLTAQIEEKETERVRMSERKALVVAELEEYQRAMAMRNEKKDRFRELVLSLQPELRHLEAAGGSCSLVKDVEKAQTVFTELVGQRNAKQKVKQTKYYMEASVKMEKDNAEMSANIRIMQKQIKAAKEGLQEISAMSEE